MLPAHQPNFAARRQKTQTFYTPLYDSDQHDAIRHTPKGIRREDLPNLTSYILNFPQVPLLPLSCAWRGSAGACHAVSLSGALGHAWEEFFQISRRDCHIIYCSSLVTAYPTRTEHYTRTKIRKYSIHDRTYFSYCDTRARTCTSIWHSCTRICTSTSTCFGITGGARQEYSRDEACYAQRSSNSHLSYIRIYTGTPHILLQQYIEVLSHDG